MTERRSLSTRRSFIRTAGLSALVAGAADAVRRPVFAQSPASPRVVVDASRTIATLDRRLFWIVPQAPRARDLWRDLRAGIQARRSERVPERRADEVRTLNVPIVRYPGGNFVSGYDWLDGVGPASSRPAVLDRAWNSAETNQFGTNEFLAWCRAAGAEPILGLNFGTGTAEKAAALVEYCNVPSGTKWSDLRRRHGVESPWAVRCFCLGNEMDGTWQIGRMTAVEYGRKAADAARQMRAVDREPQLAALVTDATRVVRQTIYYPYAWALAHARGDVLNLAVESPAYEIPSIGRVPYVDVAGTIDPSTGHTALFMLNRDLEKAREADCRVARRRSGQDIGRRRSHGERPKSRQHARRAVDCRPATARHAASCNSDDVRAAAPLI